MLIKDCDYHFIIDVHVLHSIIVLAENVMSEPNKILNSGFVCEGEGVFVGG